MVISLTDRLKSYSSRELIDLMVNGRLPYVGKEMFDVPLHCECGDYFPKFAFVVFVHKSFLKYDPVIKFFCDKCKPEVF